MSRSSTLGKYGARNAASVINPALSLLGIIVSLSPFRPFIPSIVPAMPAGPVSYPLSLGGSLGNVAAKACNAWIGTRSVRFASSDNGGGAGGAAGGELAGLESDTRWSFIFRGLFLRLITGSSGGHSHPRPLYSHLMQMGVRSSHFTLRLRQV